MVDKELWNAINVIARNFGLMTDRQRLVIVEDDVPEVARCLAPDERLGRMRLMCSRPSGHDSPHSWESALVGIVAPGRQPGSDSACGAVALDDPRITCAKPRGHGGDHQSAVKDLGYDTWPQKPGSPRNAVAENARRAGFAPGPDSVTASYDVDGLVTCPGCMCDAPGAPMILGLPFGCPLHPGNDALPPCDGCNWAARCVLDGCEKAKKHVASPDPSAPRT